MGYLDNKGLEKYTWNVRNRVAKNEQMTKVEPLVSFCPAPETDLEPIVNFAVKEILPAEGTKGPDNPSTIAGVSEIKLSRCGKNLFPLPRAPKYNTSQTINDVTFTMNEDGWITCNGTASARTSYFFVVSGMRIKIPAGTYTISGMPDASYGQSVGLNICTYLSFNPDTGFWNTATDTGNGATFTTTDARYMVVGIAVASGVKLENYVIKPQLEVGSKATPFESYKGNDFSFSLNGTYYGGSVNLASGEMTVSYKGIVFDGTEDWSGPDDHGGGCYSFGLSINSHGTSFPYDSPNAHLLSSHFDYIANTSLQSNHFYVPGQGGFLAVYTMFCTTLQDWKDWLASQSQNGTPLVIVYCLETPQTVQLNPIQVKSLASSDKYSHPVNYVYSNQESVQVGWIREDFIHKTGNETIGGLKTFKNSRDTSVAGDKTTTFVVRNPAVERGIRRADGSSYSAIIFADNEGDIDQTYDGRLGIIEVCSPKIGTNERIYLECYKYSSESTDYAKNVRLEVGYDLNEIPYSSAPSTSLERTDGTDIVTRDWLPKDTRIPQKPDLWNWQKTEIDSIVQFNPLPETKLEPVVNFLFKETLPAEGDKSPTNPSTIAGVTSFKVGHSNKNIWQNVHTSDQSGLTITYADDGTITLNGKTTDVAIITANIYNVIPTNVETRTITISANNPEANSNVSIRWGTSTGLYKLNVVNRVLKLVGPPESYPNGIATFQIRVLADVTLDNFVLRPQIEFGDTPTEYEIPTYQVHSISLGDTYYGGSLDLSTGILTQTYNGLVLDGTESWTLAVSGGTYNGYRINISPMAFGGVPLQSQYQKEKCTHFNVSNGQSTEHMHFIAYGIRLEIYSDQPTVEAFKTWLAGQASAGTPVTVVYPVYTPIEVQLTPTQIASLPSLDKYTPRINTIYTDAASVQVGYQRYADEGRNADSASKLQTSVSLTTNLASTTAISFDGSADQNSIPVSGVLSISNGGTGSNTQNFVDLSNSQVINGVKTFGSTIEGVVDRSIKDGSGNVIANTYATKAVATSLADGLMSSTDKSKLDSIGTVFNFKGSVADIASLPGSGNTAGDAYLVQSPLGLQAWNGTSWVDIGSSALLPISDNEIDAVFA